MIRMNALIASGIFSRRGPARNDLLQEVRFNGNLTGKGPAVSGDQQQRQRDARGKQGQGYRRCEPVVAVHHGDGDQRAESLQQNPGPFDPAGGGLADYNRHAWGAQHQYWRSFQAIVATAAL